MLVIALYLWDDFFKKWPPVVFFCSWDLPAIPLHPLGIRRRWGTPPSWKFWCRGPCRECLATGSGWCLDVLRTNSLTSLVCSNARVSRVSWKATDPHVLIWIHVRLTNHLDQLNQLKDGEAYMYWWILLNGCHLDQPTKLRNVRTEMSQRTKLQLGAIAGDMPPKNRPGLIFLGVWLKTVYPQMVLLKTGRWWLKNGFRGTICSGEPTSLSLTTY